MSLIDSSTTRHRRRSDTSARSWLRATPPISVVAPADVAALALHIISNTALTGATYDVGDGQQLVG